VLNEAFRYSPATRFDDIRPALQESIKGVAPPDGFGQRLTNPPHTRLSEKERRVRATNEEKAAGKAEVGYYGGKVGRYCKEWERRVRLTSKMGADPPSTGRIA